MNRTLALTAALALAACQPQAQDRAAERDAAEAPTPAAETPAPQDSSSTIVALDSEGLRLVDETTGSTRLIPFGAPQAETITAITALVGNATETGQMEECGPGPLSFANFPQGLRLWFSQGAFSGWESTEALTTLSGISAEATRAELEAAGVSDFTRDTLEDEFDLGGIYGVMEPGGQEVALLHTGDNCFMR
ncbi:hypothetical protein [Brevundimonas aveniformis]|uniref:hypothetical protein n=1 Tax=Brevundimonas aveniformis TaxID=370977 RepID=UPI0024900CB3|nr:hypothetical protein [Brevundimonas aveniformis]